MISTCSGGESWQGARVTSISRLAAVETPSPIQRLCNEAAWAAGQNHCAEVLAGLIKALLKAAAKAITQRDPDAPQPKTKRRRRGGTESRAPLCLTRQFPQRIAARGRYAALRTGVVKAGCTIDLGMETPSEQSGSFNLSLCNPFGGFEDMGGDHGLEVFDAPDAGAALISPGL